MKHQNIVDRIACANKFIGEFNLDIPIYVDNMDDEFETKFSAWPFRFYMIKEGKFDFIAEPDDSSFDLTKIYNY